MSSRRLWLPRMPCWPRNDRERDERGRRAARQPDSDRLDLPWLIPGAAGEGAIARFIAAWLQERSVDVKLQEVAPGRPKVIGRLRGDGSGPMPCINAHIDTVGAADWPERAFVPERDRDHLLGLGAIDDKGHCAAAMLALARIAEAGQRPHGET